MVKQWDWRWALTPADVFRHPWDWTPISRSEASSLRRWMPVVVVARRTAGEHAEWFDEQNPLSRGASPHALRVLRYYRYVGPVRSMRAVMRARVAGPPPEAVVEEEAPREPAAAPVEALTWVEVELVDDDGNSVGGEQYRLELPDGSLREGALDAQGLVRVDGIDPGTCRISFPNLDARDWRRI
jgi:hypothetical protein